MFTITVQPRFGDLDALGHVNNTVPSFWFETGRTRILQIFDPDLKVDKTSFPLIMAHIDFDFTDQLFLRSEVEIRTWISKIGTKSFTVHHEAWQENRLCVKGNAVIVHFDFNTQQTTPIPEDKRKFLEEHLINVSTD
ncbi:MAG: acyl-CoA thioesterase [Treponema sp.]|nr:acyl-CoA thioesterase [Treponema sp.]